MFLGIICWLVIKLIDFVNMENNADNMENNADNMKEQLEVSLMLPIISIYKNIPTFYKLFNVYHGKLN